MSGDVHTTWIDHIPALWVEPSTPQPTRRLIIFLGHFSSTKEAMLDFVRDLADDGFVVLSFDNWQHGERGTESRDELSARCFGNFRRHMWSILGQTTLDTLRVIDWAVANLGVEPAITMGGVSLGGDISVAAAGIDHRIKRIAPVVATPDWLRPGMHDAFKTDAILPPGEPDAFAQFFYETLNPITHLDAYGDAPAMHFICGERDTHVPPEAVYRFQSALREHNPNTAEHISVEIVPGMTHTDVRDRTLWWSSCRAWLTQSP